MVTIVVTGFSGTSLGIVRCLAASNADIVVIGRDMERDQMPLYYSRIPAKKILIAHDADFVDALVEFGRSSEEKLYLMLGEDKHVMDINRRRQDVEALYRFQLPEESLVESLMDKNRFHRLAGEMNLRIPKSMRVSSRSDIKEVGAHLGFPLVVKAYLLHARKVGNELEMDDFLSSLSDENWESVIAEQWIPGGDSHLYFCLAYFSSDSKALAHVTARKIRQNPPQYGTTSLCVTVRNTRVVGETIRIFSELGYVGIGSIEYKYNSVDDEYYIMEPTVGRYDQQVALTAAAGVNLPMVDFHYLSGTSLVPGSQMNGARWIHELTDFASRFSNTQEIHESYFRNLVAADTRVLFSWRDPVPFAAVCIRKMFMTIRRLFRVK